MNELPKVAQRFLNYVSFETTSNENSKTKPSTKGQKILAQEIAKELEQIGLKKVSVDKNGYVMATLPSNTTKVLPTIGFVSHLDTSPDASGKDIKPQIIEYTGGDILLNEELKMYLTVRDFPELNDYVGKTLITTDGTTLLGADDKAGVAEIITALEYLVQHPEIPHGTIRLGLTPDEEIGRGADLFDVKKFNAEFAFTMDGGAIGELEFENFNAARAKITIQGRNVHPGTAKNKMINSILIGQQILNMLPQDEIPAKTEGYEGFYHVINFSGTVENALVDFIIRDFDRENFEARKSNMREVVAKINENYGHEVAKLELYDQYYNMKEKIAPVQWIIEDAIKAMNEVGVEPKVVPIRGGTDGARLSFMGLPTPNIFAGGHNFHGKYEFIPVYSMEKAVEVILKIVEINMKKESV